MKRIYLIIPPPPLWYLLKNLVTFIGKLQAPFSTGILRIELSILEPPSRQPHHRFQFINSKFTSPFFLNFTYCIKDTNLHGILRNYDPITQMYIFCPITKTFNAEESRPFLLPHEFVQPIEIPILEFIHNTKFNHKLYNLIQNTPYEFAVGTEELTTIKALQLLWPLLQTKNIIRILAKLLTTSDLIHDIFPHGFFPDD